LVWTLEQSGPTFTKLGQWASSRKDLFPDTICTILSKLQSNIKPHSFEFTKKCIYNAYGKNVDDLFLCLEQVPIGTGSVAQVYKGTLYDGTIVAVKVLHPHVRDLINVDLQIIKGIANGIEYIIPECHWLSLPDEADMFSQMMQQQLDLQLEGSHLNTFTKNFDSWSLVGFPTCINNESKDVLIMSWIDGIPLERFLRLGPSKCDGQIATIGLTCFLVFYLFI
jgi:aarF domain-containing kinase